MADTAQTPRDGIAGIPRALTDEHRAWRKTIREFALDVVAHVQQWGPAVILSDGDAVFQPRKVDRSGLWTAVGGRVLIYVHKEIELDEVVRLFPARRYVMIDDKLRILDAVKQVWKERVTTVFPRQGHYARDPETLRRYPPADVQVDRIGDLLGLEQTAYHGG